MKTKIEQLQEIAIAGAKTVRNCGVKKYVLAQELTFVENNRREEYFLIAHQLMKELRKNETYRSFCRLTHVHNAHKHWGCGRFNFLKSKIHLQTLPIGHFAG